jgi:hypothetical protein
MLVQSYILVPEDTQPVTDGLGARAEWRPSPEVVVEGVVVLENIDGTLPEDGREDVSERY